MEPSVKLKTERPQGWRTARRAATQGPATAASDTGPLAVDLRTWGATIDASPRVLQQALIGHSVEHSPRMLAQRRRLGQLLGPATVPDGLPSRAPAGTAIGLPVQLTPNGFFPGLTGVPALGWTEWGSTWSPIRSAIQAYGTLPDTALHDRHRQLNKLEGLADDWLLAYASETGRLSLQGQRPSESDQARRRFLQEQLAPAIQVERDEIREEERQYGLKLARGDFHLTGRDQTADLTGTGTGPRKLGVGALQDLGDTDVPALNALSSYTETAYRLQNPLLRGGAPAFKEGLRDRGELAPQRDAVARGDYTVEALIQETGLHSEMTKLALEKLAPYGGITYRGTGVGSLDEVRIGKTFTDKAFASSTEDFDVALGYLDFDKVAAMFVITSKTGRQIKEAVFGGMAGKEVLFFPGTRLVVTQAPERKTINNQPYYRVQMTEV